MLKSKLFSANQRLQNCLVSDRDHVQLNDRGTHVSLIQQSLVIIESANIEADELFIGFYGPSTASTVLSYKKKRSIINRAYQNKADNIVGRMTIKSLDDEMVRQQSSHPTLLLALAIQAAPKVIVMSEQRREFKLWGDQFAAVDSPNRENQVVPNGTNGASLVSAYRRAVSAAGQSGGLILNLGHGFGGNDPTLGQSFLPNEGVIDLAPAVPTPGLRVAGANAILIGDEIPKEKLRGRSPASIVCQTSTFYDFRVPNATQRRGFINSRKDDDEAAGTPPARARLTQFGHFQSICDILKSGNLALMIMLTCRVAGSPDFMRRLRDRFGVPIVAYRRKVAGQIQQNGKARIFLEGDSSGHGTNTPLGEIFFPLALDMVLFK